jgi:HSP20 family protein
MKTQETRENRQASGRAAQSAADLRQGRESSRDLARRTDLAARFPDPFELMRSFFNQWPLTPLSPLVARSQLGEWAPQIESFQRGDVFVVRADLPGMKQKDITVEIKDDAIVIEGERSNEREEQHEGYYSTERTYGRFCRMVPLPEGAIADSAKATFKNGVLEVVLQAPPHEVSRGRRIEIEGDAGEKR